MAFDMKRLDIGWTIVRDERGPFDTFDKAKAHALFEIQTDIYEYEDCVEDLKANRDALRPLIETDLPLKLLDALAGTNRAHEEHLAAGVVFDAPSAAAVKLDKDADTVPSQEDEEAVHEDKKP